MLQGTISLQSGYETLSLEFLCSKCYLAGFFLSCRLFLTPNAARPMNASPNNREALYHEIEHSVTPPGLLAYADD